MVEEFAEFVGGGVEVIGVAVEHREQQFLSSGRVVRQRAVGGLAIDPFEDLVVLIRFGVPKLAEPLTEEVELILATEGEQVELLTCRTCLAIAGGPQAVAGKTRSAEVETARGREQLLGVELPGRTPMNAPSIADTGLGAAGPEKRFESRRDLFLGPAA